MSAIEWTHETWNPVRGCKRVSEGCRNCYAEQIAARFSGPGQPYEGLARRSENGPRWTGHIRTVPAKLSEPLRWRKPRMVFVNSMSDLFHEDVPDDFIAAVFGVMASSPRHTFQILTKRPTRMREWFEWVRENDFDQADVPFTRGRMHCVWSALRMEAEHHPAGDGGPLHTKYCADPEGPWPLPNVWIGVSVEDQATADERIPELNACPAALRFVSHEPALGPVTFHPDWMGEDRLENCSGCVGDFDSGPDCPGHYVGGVEWVIVGGESGPGARPFDVQWARDTIAQCREAGVPCFVKQMGSQPYAFDLEDVWTLRDRKGAKPNEWPADLRVREMPEVTHNGR